MKFQLHKHHPTKTPAMIKTALFNLLFLTISFGAFAQQAQSNTVKFDTLIQHFQTFNYQKTPLNLPVIAKDRNFQVELSPAPIPFDIKSMVLKPQAEPGYPISYSVIYQNRLVSLFDKIGFVCYQIPEMTRDPTFEKALNRKKFKYHWLIGDKLVALSDSTCYFLNSKHSWTKYDDAMPLSHRPKLYEDDKYISYSDCFGEWGGTLYFYQKSTGQVFVTGATCANSIIKRDNRYFVLSHMGHMMGSADLKAIDSPDQLPKYIPKKPGEIKYVQGYNDTSKKAASIFNYYGVQIFSSFMYQDKILYLVNWREQTFLAEIDSNRIKIVNPLFNKEVYTHNPIATNYGDLTLINMDFYGTAREREVSCLLIQNGKLIKLDWNEKQTH